MTSFRRAPLASAAATAAGACLLAACQDQGPRDCTVAIAGAPELVVVAGTSGRARATAACGRGEPGAVRWRVSDTTLATVDTAGLVAGRAPGEVTLTAELGGRARAVGTVRLQVVPPYELVVTPSPLVLRPGTPGRLGAGTLPTPFTPAGFPKDVAYRSLDSCVAAVAPDGSVRAGREGATAIVATLVAAPGVRQVIPVTVREPAALRLALQRVESAGVPVAGDTLRGVVTFVVRHDTGISGRAGGRLEARLGGVLAGRVLLAPFEESLVVAVPITVDLRAREADGRPRFSAGPQTLELTLVVPDVAAAPGCPALNLGQRLALPVVIGD